MNGGLGQGHSLSLHFGCSFMEKAPSRYNGSLVFSTIIIDGSTLPACRDFEGAGAAYLTEGWSAIAFFPTL